jgi:hypothetical protein
MQQGNSAIIRCNEFSGFDRAPLSHRPARVRTAPLAVPHLPSKVEGTAFYIFLSSLPSPIFRKALTGAWDSRKNNPAAVSGPYLAGSGRCGDRDPVAGKMMEYLCDIGDFVRRLSTQLRFGELSRASLQLLRLEWRGGIAECDWIARPPDQFDCELPPRERERNFSVQAIKDAIGVRDLLFRTLSDLETAVLRSYRQSADRKPSAHHRGHTQSRTACTRIHSIPGHARQAAWIPLLVERRSPRGSTVRRLRREFVTTGESPER